MPNQTAEELIQGQWKLKCEETDRVLTKLSTIITNTGSAFIKMVVQPPKTSDLFIMGGLLTVALVIESLRLNSSNIETVKTCIDAILGKGGYAKVSQELKKQGIII